MTDILDQLKEFLKIGQAIFDFFISGIKGLIQIGKSLLSCLGLIDDVIANMPPIIIPFLGATISVVVLYFIIGLITGSQQ